MSNSTIYPGFQPQHGYTLVYENGNPRMMHNFYVCENESSEIFLTDLANIFKIKKVDKGKILVLNEDSKVGKYTVLACIGNGSYGSVYRVIDEYDQIWVIKVQGLKSGLIEERFIKRLKGIPNVIQIEETYTTDDFHFMVMNEYPSTLLDFKKRTSQEWCIILEKLLRALSAIHERGIVHCDIKPENILMDGDEPVIADFGLAGEMGEMGGLIVSWYFRHPKIAEKLLDFKDKKSAYHSNVFEKKAYVDIWALGASMFEVISRKVLFYQCGVYRDKYFFNSELQLYQAIKAQEEIPFGIYNIINFHVTKADVFSKKEHSETLIYILTEMLNSNSLYEAKDLLFLFDEKYREKVLFDGLDFDDYRVPVCG